METTITYPGIDTEQPTALLELSEANAAREMIVAAMEAEEVTDCGLAQVAIGSGVALAASRLDLLVLNRVVGLGVAEPATREMFDMVEELYRSIGVRRYALQIAPGIQPAPIDRWLSERGAIHSGSWCKLGREIDREIPPAPGSELRVTAIAREHAAIFGAVICAAYGFPEKMRSLAAATIGRAGWQHYLAWDGALPVAAGALHIHDEIAWLGMGATIPGQRGRGAQSAIIHRRLEDARERGCRLAVTETAEGSDGSPAPSCRNLLRAGFRVAYSRANYLVKR
jgi:GNAT superfamily N-acetyltransferase